MRVDYEGAPRAALWARLYTIDSWYADVALWADASQRYQHPHHSCPIRMMLRPRP
jgi:hypothetical protein